MTGCGRLSGGRRPQQEAGNAKPRNANARQEASEAKPKIKREETATRGEQREAKKRERQAEGERSEAEIKREEAATRGEQREATKRERQAGGERSEAEDQATAEPGSPGRPRAPLGGRSEATGGPYFAVGIVNSAPLAVLSGHRCITDFCFV